MALTILEAAKLSQNPLQQGIVEVFAKNNPVLQVMPFIDIAGNAYSYNREGVLPGIAWRGINESYTESTGVVNPQTETLAILGGDSDIDVALVKQGVGSADIRATYDAMKAKAASLNFLWTFFNSDGTDPRQPIGLRNRLIGAQVIDQGSTSGGDVLTLDKVDQLIDAVEGDPTALFMSRTLRRKLNALIGTSGALMLPSVDAFGNQVMKYRDIPIYTAPTDASMGPYGALFPFTEANPGGGAAASSSIYAIRFDVADGIHGIQTEPMSVRDLGEQQVKPVYRTRIEWYCGFAVKHPRAAARLRGIKNA